jgi:transcriptional regulator with XRE-family HTH domain
LKRSVQHDKDLSGVAPLVMLVTAIKERRLAHNMTQEELGQRAGVHIRTIRRIENCHRMPEDRTIHLLARLLQDDPGVWMSLLKEAKRIVRKAGGLDAFEADNPWKEVERTLTPGDVP